LAVAEGSSRARSREGTASRVSARMRTFI
jgi:hypothetical protein